MLVVTIVAKLIVIGTRCSIRKMALLHVACGETRETALLHAWVQIHAYSYIQQTGRSVKTMNAKDTKKITDS